MDWRSDSLTRKYPQLADLIPLGRCVEDHEQMVRRIDDEMVADVNKLTFERSFNPCHGDQVYLMAKDGRFLRVHALSGGITWDDVLNRLLCTEKPNDWLFVIQVAFSADKVQLTVCKMPKEETPEQFANRHRAVMSTQFLRKKREKEEARNKAWWDFQKQMDSTLE